MSPLSIDCRAHCNPDSDNNMYIALVILLIQRETMRMTRQYVLGYVLSKNRSPVCITNEWANEGTTMKRTQDNKTICI